MQRTWMNTSKAFSSRRSRAGFTLLEVIVALIVITTMLSVAAVWLGRYNDRVANEVVAGQMRRLGDALKHYVDDNAAELSKGGTPRYVPWDKVKPYLPPGLDNKTVNPLGQTYEGRIRVVTLPNGSKRVDSLIYTDGAVDVGRHSMKIARLLGAGGLYFDWNRVKGVPGNKPTYWTAGGQVDDPTSLDSFWFGGHLNQSDISLIMYVPFLGEETGNDPDLDSLLHRKSVAGKPELNRMETDVDMNSNSVNNVGSVAFKGGNREVTGVKRIQFEKPSNADAVSVAISNYGWFTIGDPSGKRTNLWASAIEADGDLTVHANSTVEGSSTVKGSSIVKGSSSIGGDESVGGALSATRVETTGAVVAGSDLAIKKGDLVFQGTSVVGGGSCSAVWRLNMTHDGDLAVCKEIDGKKKWSVVTSPFSQGRSGSFNLNFMTGVKNNTTMYKDALDWNRNQVTGFKNGLKVPVFVTALATGDFTDNVSRCFIGVYPADGNGYTSSYEDPIAFVNNAQHAVWDKPVKKLYTGVDVCSATFVAQPGERYNAVSGSSDSVDFIYTY